MTTKEQQMIDNLRARIARLEQLVNTADDTEDAARRTAQLNAARAALAAKGAE